MSGFSPWMLLVYALCIPIAVLGVWFVGNRPSLNQETESEHDSVRDTDSPPSQSQRWDGQSAHSGSSLLDRLKRYRSQLTPPSRMVTGLCMILVAYHAAAYISPDHWFGLKVPLERWYILLGGISLALCGTLAIDRLETTNDQRPPRP